MAKLERGVLNVLQMPNMMLTQEIQDKNASCVVNLLLHTWPCFLH